MEPDINNMTLNEYLMYEGKHRELEKGYTSRISVAPKRNRTLVYLDSDKDEVAIDNMTLEEYERYELAMSSMKSEIQEDSLDKILDDLFKIGVENIRKMEHEVPNRCDDITDYEDSDQEDGELLDLPTYSATNEFLVEDVEIDEDYDIDHSNTKEALQWSPAKDPFLLIQVDTHGVVLGLYLATGKHFKFVLVGYHSDDDDGLELWMLLMEADLKHGLVKAISSSSRANSGEESINDSSDNVDTKKLKENIHAIQEDCMICEGPHLTKECPHKKEDKAVEQSKYIGSFEKTIIKYCDESIKKKATNDERIRKFIENTDLNLRELDTTRKNLQEDEGDMDDIWDIMIKDVERIRKILIPTIHTLPNLESMVQPYMPRGPVHDEVKLVREEELEYDIPLQNSVMQPLTPQTTHITLPNDDYVAPATSPILDKHLNELREEFSNITRVAEKANGNLVNDVKELSDILKTYDF
ncbi:hypothetical protein Tco_1262517 [Tanacetum coccineum]